MKRIGISVYLTAITLLSSSGCDTHRDLYDMSAPTLRIESDWGSALGQEQMLDATVMLYREGAMTKEFFSRPNGVSAQVTRGQYDILAFNGVMESESATNLNHVYFRGTDRLETFEAYAAEGVANSRLARAEDDYIASNEMELFAFGYAGLYVEENARYALKYRGGRVQPPVDWVSLEQDVEVMPRVVSYRFQVRLTNVVNPRSALYASGALRGFAGSVFLAPSSGIPQAGIRAAHHLNLTTLSNVRTSRNNLNEEVGILHSGVFVSFGPPLPDDPDRIADADEYTFEPSFVLKDNTVFAPGEPIDITRQVNEAIRRIHRHHIGDEDIAIDENLFTIEIADRVELPVISSTDVVEVTDWDDGDERIIIWIKP